jgi:predicted methyltransferase
VVLYLDVIVLGGDQLRSLLVCSTTLAHDVVVVKRSSWLFLPFS